VWEFNPPTKTIQKYNTKIQHKNTTQKYNKIKATTTTTTTTTTTSINNNNSNKTYCLDKKIK